jgi:hypothetical protein
MRRSLWRWFHGSGRPIRQCAGRGRPALDLLEDRTLPSNVSFNPVGGWLTLAGSSAEVSAAPDGVLAIRIDGMSAGLTGLNVADLRGITLAGGGTSDMLTLGDLATTGDLAITSDGGVTVTGAVDTAGTFRVLAAGLLDVEGDLRGARIDASADYVVDDGWVSAESAIAVTARNYLGAGTLAAPGGSVRVDFTESYIDTAAAMTSTAGLGGAGGTVTIDGGSTGRLFTSGRLEAGGTTGGAIDLFGADVLLVGASVDASGSVGRGGTLRIGGDSRGSNPAVPNARTVDVTGSTTLRADGFGGGGQVIVWSQVRTDFAGSASACGTGSADGGAIETSSAGELNYTGQADAGKGGTLLLDPKNLTVSNTPAGIFPQFNLVNPGKNGSFGTQILTLSTGNIAVSDPTFNKNAGAVYLFSGKTGGLISALIGRIGGSKADRVGTGPTADGIKALPSGNFVVDSFFWNGDRGAVTWVNGTTGLSGTVSSGNSLVGTLSGTTLTGDVVGLGDVYVLTNGNYVVSSPGWNRGRGAVTFGNGSAGVVGAVSAANSLVGSSPGDRIGSLPQTNFDNVVNLSNGNFVVPSPMWNSNRGAVTWGNGTTGIAGVISAANSLIGSVPGDSVGLSGGGFNPVGITALNNGNYVVSSTQWNLGAGAATWGNGTTGVTGSISSTNSLIGDINAHPSGDQVGTSVSALTDGNYVVASPDWNFNVGAATWGNGATGVTGFISSSNSLVGSTDGDDVGSDGVATLSNGNYVVLSTNWSIPAGSSTVGAATWANGSSGLSGAVSTTNSLVGSAFGDLAEAQLYALANNGNYVLDSPHWNGERGAVTWGNGTSGVKGVISAGNSLVGTTAGDHLGDDFGSNGAAFDTAITVLSNGNYVVGSPNWTNPIPSPLADAGAVTWGNGATGTIGTISAANSLIGSAAGDQVGANFDFSSEEGRGGVTALANGNYVIASVFWNGETGAVTWGDGSAGVTGMISSANSLIGAQAGDAVGGLASGFFFGGITALPNGNYVVASPNFGGAEGAVTWGNGSAGSHGVVSSSHSLVGSASGDMLGNAIFNVTALGNSDYVVYSPSWNNGVGAVTWASGTSGATLDGQHTSDAQNSIEGVSTGANSFDEPAAGPGTLPGSFVAPFSSEKGGVVSVGFTDPNQLTDLLAAGQSLAVTPGFLIDTLDTGTAVTAQASGTLTVGSPIVVSAGGHGGALTLQAATVALDANITTDGGKLTLSGAVTPGGGSPSLVEVAANTVAFGPDSSYVIQLNGATAGAGFSQLQVTGAIDLGNATLTLASAGHFSSGESFVILTSTTPIATTFAGLPEGGTISAGGQQFTISYQDNEVTLTVAAGSNSIPTVTASPASLAVNANTIIIRGSHFSTAAHDSVTFNLGAAGTVTAASASQLTVTFTTAATIVGALTASVSANGISSGGPVQVAILHPVVTKSTAGSGFNASLTIHGFGFSSTAGDDTVFLGGIPYTPSIASSTELTLSNVPLAIGKLTASVTVDNVSSGAALQVATVTPVVTNTGTTNLLASNNNLTIEGFGFSVVAKNDVVIFSGGVKGVVTAATPTTLTVSHLSGLRAGALTAVVKVLGVSSGVVVPVATVIPVVTPSDTPLSPNATTLVIQGFGFSSTAGDNMVTFSNGVTGTVLSATATRLVVTKLKGLTAGVLQALLTINGESSAMVDVATVT